jgi:hypothetical protein
MTVASESVAGQPAARPVLSLPLVLFLVAVAAVVGLALRTRFPTPDLTGAVRMLADGDLDGTERTRMLARVVEQAAAAPAPAVADRWAGLLAAVALGDRVAFQAALAQLGGEAALQVPEPAARELLHLGDPMLGNVLTALSAGAVGDRELARQKWAQVQAQARLTARPFALELASAALQR